MQCQKTQEDQNQKRAVVTGFHDDTTDQEEQQQLKENVITMGMTMEHIQRKCSFIDNDERDKFVRSANILMKDLRGRKKYFTKDLDTSNAASTQDTTYHLKRSK